MSKRAEQGITYGISDASSFREEPQVEVSSRILWKPGQPFQPDAITKILGTEPQESTDESGGFKWRPGSFGTTFQFFPETNMAKFDYFDTSAKRHFECPVDRICTNRERKGTAIKIFSTRGIRRDSVILRPTGAIRLEYDFTKIPLPLRPNTPITTEVLPLYATLTMQEAARLVGRTVANISGLCRKGRLLSHKRGNQRFVDKKSLIAYYQR